MSDEPRVRARHLPAQSSLRLERVRAALIDTGHKVVDCTEAYELYRPGQPAFGTIVCHSIEAETPWPTIADLEVLG